MNFYRNRGVAALQVFLGALNVALSIHRYVWRGHHDLFTITQICMWSFVTLLWAWMATIHWRFNTDALEQRPIGARRRIPYSDIVSVDPISSVKGVTSFAIVYGANIMFQQPQRMVVDPGERAAFLEELERRAPQATFNV